MKIRRTISAVAAAALLAIPVAAAAQPVPTYASHEEQLHGTIASFDGKYDLYVHDDRGYVDTVHLHDGTVINPTGLTLAAGETVTVLGRADGNAFDANEIDTPYQRDDGYATSGDGGYAVGPDAGYVSPYPYYSYYPAYALSYPAFISLGFGSVTAPATTAADTTATGTTVTGTTAAATDAGTTVAVVTTVRAPTVTPATEARLRTAAVRTAARVRTVVARRIIRSVAVTLAAPARRGRRAAAFRVARRAAARTAEAERTTSGYVLSLLLLRL